MNMLGYDATVAALESRGVPREKALKFAREQWPEVAAQQDAAAEKREAVSEKREQAEVVKLYRAFGFEVFTTSQSRASRVSVGIPDVYAINPTKRVALWHEVKRSNGARVSQPQLRFAMLCAEAGVVHLMGDRQVARDFLVDRGIARLVDGVLEPVR